MSSKRTFLVSGGAAAIAAFGYNPEWFIHWGGEAISHQFTQMMLLFTAAAFVHSANVKKGIKEAAASAVTELMAKFEGRVDAMSDAMTKSMDKIASALKQDIAQHSARLDAHDVRMGKLEAEKHQTGDGENGNR